MEVLNGAFKAELVKGKWQYEPNYDKMNKKPVDKGSEKEQPQYSFIAKAEKETSKSYQLVLKAMTIEVVQFLKKKL